MRAVRIASFPRSHDSPPRKALLQIHLCVLLWGLTAILGKLISLPATARHQSQSKAGLTAKTIYEIKLPVASLGLVAPLTLGTQFGLGMAINDDEAEFTFRLFDHPRIFVFRRYAGVR
jgi:hypothetical protein